MVCPFNSCAKRAYYKGNSQIERKVPNYIFGFAGTSGQLARLVVD